MYKHIVLTQCISLNLKILKYKIKSQRSKSKKVNKISCKKKLLKIVVKTNLKKNCQKKFVRFFVRLFVCNLCGYKACTVIKDVRS